MKPRPVFEAATQTAHRPYAWRRITDYFALRGTRDGEATGDGIETVFEISWRYARDEVLRLQTNKIAVIFAFFGSF